MKRKILWYTAIPFVIYSTTMGIIVYKFVQTSQTGYNELKYEKRDLLKFIELLQNKLNGFKEEIKNREQKDNQQFEILISQKTKIEGLIDTIKIFMKERRDLNSIIEYLITNDILDENIKKLDDEINAQKLLKEIYE